MTSARFSCLTWGHSLTKTIPHIQTASKLFHFLWFCEQYLDKTLHSLVKSLHHNRSQSMLVVCFDGFSQLYQVSTIFSSTVAWFDHPSFSLSFKLSFGLCLILIGQTKPSRAACVMPKTGFYAYITQARLDEESKEVKTSKARFLWVNSNQYNSQTASTARYGCFDLIGLLVRPVRLIDNCSCFQWDLLLPMQHNSFDRKVMCWYLNLKTAIDPSMAIL